MSSVDPFLSRTHIAYFSMEIAVRPEMHTYSGGLGILAGDMACSCADLELPVVFVTLLSRAGYFRQVIDADGRHEGGPQRRAQPERPRRLVHRSLHRGRDRMGVGQDGHGAEPHAAALYDQLDHAVLPLFYADSARWRSMMKQAISNIASYFNSQRMMRRYATEAYLRW